MSQIWLQSNRALERKSPAQKPSFYQLLRASTSPVLLGLRLHFSRYCGQTLNLRDKLTPGFNCCYLNRLAVCMLKPDIRRVATDSTEQAEPTWEHRFLIWANVNHCKGGREGFQPDWERKDIYFVGHHQSPTPFSLEFTFFPLSPSDPCCVQAVWEQSRPEDGWICTATQPKENILAMAPWQASDELPVEMYNIPLEVMQDLKERYGQRLAGLIPRPAELSKLNEPHAFPRNTRFFHSPKRLFFICIPVLFPLLIMLYFLVTLNLAVAVKGSRRP